MATPAGFLTGLQDGRILSHLGKSAVKQLLSSGMIYFQLQAGSVNSLTNGEAQSLKAREHATQRPLAEIASFTSRHN